MIPSLRAGILSLETRGSASDRANSVLYQLQTMFGHLLLSRRRAFDPRPLCRAYRDFEGRPVDLLTQVDASEFLTQFFDKLEGESPAIRGLLQRIVRHTEHAYACVLTCVLALIASR